MKIAAVVITFNRRMLLDRCLKAIDAQTRRPDIIYIVDNASTDDTAKYLASREGEIPTRVITLPENMGGAGGFYTGLKAAHETRRYDYFWIMDDDGVPAPECLAELLTLVPYHNIAPLVLDIDSPSDLAFPGFIRSTVVTHEKVKELYGPKGIIPDYANPFNGILLSSRLLDDVGYPKKEMFIWGDEFEFYLRVRDAKMSPVTVVNAIHYHPKDRTEMYPDYRGHKCLVYVDSPIRRYCYYRNYTHLMRRERHLGRIFRYVFAYAIFYLKDRRLDFKGLGLCLKAMWHGYKGDFSHTRKYL